MAISYLGNPASLGQHLAHGPGQVTQAGQHPGTVRRAPNPDRVGHRCG